MTGASPQVLHALYQLQRDIAIQNVSVSNYYAEQRLLEPLLHGNVPPRGHVDGGALATTIDRKDYIWSYHAYSDEERSRIPALKVADDTLHVPHGCGYVKVPCSNEPGYLFVECYHTPQIPAAILSPFAMCKALGCRRYCTISNLIDDSAQLQLRDCYHCSQDLQIDLQLIRGLLYSDPLIAPTAREHNSVELPQPAPTDTCNVIPRSLVPSVPIRCIQCTDAPLPVHTLSRDQQRHLWHMRLGHYNDRYISDLHHYVDGVPKLPRSDALHKCPWCTRAKLHKASRGPPHPLQSEFCWQNIQIDFGFFVVRSSGRKEKSKKKDKQTDPEDATSPLEINIMTRSAARKLAQAATSTPDTVSPSTTSDHDTTPPVPAKPAPSQQSRKSASSSKPDLSSP